MLNLKIISLRCERFSFVNCFSLNSFNFLTTTVIITEYFLLLKQWKVYTFWNKVTTELWESNEGVDDFPLIHTMGSEVICKGMNENVKHVHLLFSLTFSHDIYRSHVKNCNICWKFAEFLSRTIKLHFARFDACCTSVQTSVWRITEHCLCNKRSVCESWIFSRIKTSKHSHPEFKNSKNKQNICTNFCSSALFFSTHEMCFPIPFWKCMQIFEKIQNCMLFASDRAMSVSRINSISRIMIPYPELIYQLEHWLQESSRILQLQL